MSVKILCTSCERLAPPARFRLDGAALVLTCARCDAELRVDASAPAAVVEAVPAGVTVGPTPAPLPRVIPSAPVRSSLALASSAEASNVVALRTAPDVSVERALAAADGDPFTAPAGHCPKCVTPRAEAASACPACGLTFASVDVATLRPPDWLASRWREVLRAWGSDLTHDRLRAEAVARGGLVELGRLYRIRLAEVPDDPYAKRAREELLRQASVPIAFRAAQSGDAPNVIKYAVVGVALLMLLAALVVLLRTVFVGMQ